MEEQKGSYTPSTATGSKGFDAKEPLDKIIDKINEKYKGSFSEADKVLINTLQDKLMKDNRLAKMAKTSDPQIFADAIFPKAFADVAQESFMESQETYTSLFEDKTKYDTIMQVLAEYIYREMRKK